MPGAVRIGDMSAGHPHCYPATPAVGCSDNVIINGRGAVRLNDGWQTHGACPVHSPHAGTSSSGSGTVFINGLPACRIGDSISCGDTMAEGSNDVIIGD